jgi:plastocyanin
MRSAVLPVLVALAALVAAGPAVTRARTIAAGLGPARTWTVWAGEPGDPPREMPEHSEAMRFFPSQLQINAGDSVVFRTSEGHSVTLLGPRKAQEFRFVVPDAKGGVYERVDDASGAPFWFSGKPKFLYDLQTFVRSAGSTTIAGVAFHQRVLGDPRFLPGAHKSVTFRFPNVGTYRFDCMFHYPAMKVVIVVRPAGTPVPSEASVTRAIAKEFDAAVATQKALAKTTPPRNTVYAGIGKNGVELNVFLPRRLEISAGTAVAFVNKSSLAPAVGLHNELFGDDEAWNQEFFKRSGQFNRPGPNGQVGPEFVYGTDPPGRYTYTGSNHKNGFLVTPLKTTNKIIFTKPGTYHYYCELHGKKMAGEVVVK